MSHVQVHEHAQTLAHPSHCHSCGYGGPDRRFYVDTGINTEWDGQIILCDACMLHTVVSTYGFNPFDALEIALIDKREIVDEYAADRELLNTLRQGLAILGLTTTSLIRLANFLEEEKDGSGRSELPISSDQGELKFDSNEVEPTESEQYSGIGTDSSDIDSSSSDSESNESLSSGLSLS